MQKFWGLALIFGIASLASAGLTVSKTEVAKGETVTISYIAGAGGVNSIAVRTVDDDSAKAVTTGNETIHAGFNLNPQAGLGKGVGGMLYDGGTTDAFGGAYFHFGIQPPGPIIVVFRFDYTVALDETLETITITLGAGEVVDGAGQSTNITGETVSFDIIPEPATMVLLGLGGLLLRRKK